ncbi:MAG: hypothetical protein JNJ80_09775 [Gemmatimonadetes bacterium]|nr:hypothetical protein [Gemmatimonadota bacterium]
MKTLTRIGVLGLVAALAACNQDGTDPSNQLLDLTMDRDLAVQTADAAAEDVELMGGAGGPLGLGFAAAAAEDDVPFRCGTHQRNNLTVVRTCTFKDAAGATQAVYHPLTTASATIHAEINGSVTREHWSAEVSRVRDLVVSGLAGQETTRTWNGTGSGESTRERHTENGNREYQVEGAVTITAVVVPVPRTDDTWPLSGTISRQAKVTVVGGPNDGTVRERTVTITFNGTRLVPITVNGKSFTFDLRTRRIVRDD